MKRTVSILLAVLLTFGSASFGASAYRGKYMPDGMDTDYYLLVTADDESTQLGSLSAKYESNGNPATISAGNDTGGVSYGAYQFSSRYGVPLTFVNWCISSGEGVQTGERLKAAYELDENTYGENFNAEWKLIAQESPEAFLRLQHSFTKARFYDVVVGKLEKSVAGFDIDNYTIALKNVIWSRAVQNGVNSDVITKAFENLGGFSNQPEDVLIKAIYAQASKLVDEPPYADSIKIERSSAEKYQIDVETVEGKYLYYHSRNSSDIQVSVYRRLAIRELKEALDMFIAAGGVLTPDEPVLPPEEGTTQPDGGAEVTPPAAGDEDYSNPLTPVDPPQTEDESTTGNGEIENPPAQQSWILTVFELIADFFVAIISFFSNLFG